MDEVEREILPFWRSLASSMAILYPYMKESILNLLGVYFSLKLDSNPSRPPGEANEETPLKERSTSPSGDREDIGGRVGASFKPSISLKKALRLS